MNRIPTSNFLLILFCCSLVFGVSCKNQQKLAEQEALKVKAENTAKAKALLHSILNDDGQMTLDEKEEKLRQAKALYSDDPEVLDLIAQVEALLEEERNAPPTEEAPVVEKDVSVKEQLGELFGKIAASGSSNSANALIDQGLGMFASPEVPVLIIISRSGEIKDYDEPTTILKYMNYLKDQKSNPNSIHNLVMDDSGKIKELELLKR